MVQVCGSLNRALEELQPIVILKPSLLREAKETGEKRTLDWGGVVCWREHAWWLFSGC